MTDLRSPELRAPDSRPPSKRGALVRGALITLAAALATGYGLGAAFAFGGARAWVGPTVVILASAGAALALLLPWWRRRRGEPATAPGDDTCRGYLYFGVAAATWFAGEAMHAISQLVISRTTASLSFADLFYLLALIPLTVGLAVVSGPVGPWWRYALGTYVCAAALFVIGWVALFGPLYRASGESPGAFLVELVIPLADIVLLSAALPLVVAARSPWRLAAVGTYVAVAALAASDIATTVLRLHGATRWDGPELAPRLLAYLFIGVIPWLVRPGGVARRPVPAVPALVTVLATGVVVARTVLGGPLSPVLPIVAGTVVVALVILLLGLAGEAARLSRTADAADTHLRVLAESTGDAVLIIDMDGTLRSASSGVTTHFGYRPEDLVGERLADFLHPEDLPHAARSTTEFMAGHTPVRHVTARVRAADGTWRPTEATLTRYQRPGEVDQLLLSVRDLSDQVALQQQVTHLTFHDGLTGLPNRAYFEERVREVLERRWGSCPAAVIFLDLDGFTDVNDSAGHAAGDYLLAQAARRLRAAVPGHDTVARFGGDEFAVLVEKRAEAGIAVELAERLLRALTGEPFHVADRDIPLTASLGVAFAEEGLDAATLIRNSDVATARAKELGGGRVEVFASHMHADVVRRLGLLSDLQRALSENRLAVEYQPVVELATSRVTGVEALLRWWRDDTLVPPEEFIDSATESGLIVPIGTWVLREACRQVAEWRRSSWEVGLSVNLSSRQVAAPRFVETVREVLADTGLPPEALTLEVTEEVLVEDAEQTVARLSALRQLGVRLAIDDFGTGYASLAHLRQLAVDVIKIAPSFVAGLGRDETLTLLTRAIVQLGRDLGLVVVAEGVERPEQLEALREMECPRGQGYLVARPMGARRVESLARPLLPS